MGKLEVTSIDSSDGGEYECSLPDGKKYKYIITVIDLPSISFYETRTSLKQAEGFYSIDLNESIEQVCSSATTANFLNIEWFDQNGNVCLYF